MKKVFFSLLVLAASINAMATVTARAKLTLTNGTTSNAVVVVLDDEATALSSVELYEGGMGAPTLAPYISADAKKYRIYVATSLEDVKLGYKVPATGDYTLSVSEVTGTINFIAPDGSLVVLADGQSWNVTATETEVNAAFTINPTQTAFVCQVAGGLSFHGDQAYTGLQVLDENDVVVEAAFDLAAGEDKFVAIAAAGRYYIKNGEQKIYFVVR